MSRDADSELTFSTASELSERMRSGELSSREVVTAHIRRCEAVEPKINALTVRRFDDALVDADRADQQIKSGSPLGPLHGVPITIKDAYAVAGTVSSIGLTQVADSDRAMEDSPLVRRLRHAGAIVIGKTNVPQLMFDHECDNPRNGQSRNPWNLDRTCGGSSGGEAAIIAAGGSPLGLGSDLGGSIRIPSHFCGIAGIKPTSGLLTGVGSFSNLRGMTTISFQPGPMARCVDDLVLALRALTQQIDPQDVQADAAPQLSSQLALPEVTGLRVGVMTSHPFFPAAPPVQRAVQMAADALSDSGVAVEPFEPPEFEAVTGAYLGIMSADGGADLRRLLATSKVNRGLRQTLLLSRLPQFVRQPLAMVLGVCGQPSWSFALRKTGPRSADQVWQLARYRIEYTHRIRELLAARELDAILLPPHALPAFRHGQGKELILPACYGYWANLLEMPAGTVPVDRIRADEQVTERPLSFDVAQRNSRSAELESVGLPLGVQVVASHWQEATVLGIMRAIEQKVGFHDRPDL